MGRKKIHETNKDRQKVYRYRKEANGRFMQVFVPTEIADRIKGKPQLLVKAIQTYKDRLDLLVKLWEEMDDLKDQLKRAKEDSNYWYIFYCKAFYVLDKHDLISELRKEDVPYDHRKKKSARLSTDARIRMSVTKIEKTLIEEARLRKIDTIEIIKFLDTIVDRI